MYLKLFVVCIFAMAFVHSAPVDPISPSDLHDMIQELETKGMFPSPDDLVKMLGNKYLTSDGQELMKSLMGFIPAAFNFNAKK
ncbi:hypothetical protein CBL_03819 [Carabus blaptoides fortunei]